MLTFTKTSVAVIALVAVAGSAMAAEPLISPADLSDMMAAGNVAIIDVRSDLESATNEDFPKGHIPGAVYANYKKAGWRGDQGDIHYMLPDPERVEALIQSLGVDDADTVVVYGAGVSPKALDLGATTRVYWTFKAMGHDNVSILDGGIKAWTDAGYDLATGNVTPEPGDWAAELDTSYLVDAKMVAAAIEGATELVDSRPTPHFAADAQAGYARNPGTIPTAVNVPVPAVVGEGGMGFKSTDDLMALFTKVGVEPGEEIYSFCYTGHQASVVWFVASELLGMDIKLYDGSMYDWTQVYKGPTVIGKNPEAS